MKKLLLLISIFVFSYGVLQAQTATTDATVNNITQSSASVSGTANANGGTYGVVFSVADNAAFTNKVDFTASPASITGSNQQSFTANITGLNPGVTYYYAIVLQTSGLGGGAYVTDGGTHTFTTNAAPEGFTGSASNITTTTVDLTGSANAHNNGTYDVYLVYRKQTVGIWIEGSIVGTVSGSTTQSFNSSVSGLDAGTDYYFATRLKTGTTIIATSDPKGTFTTAAPPSVTTGTSVSVTNTSGTLNGSGNANNAGDFSTFIGYKISGTPNYTFVAGTPATATSAGGLVNFHADITGLNPNQNYEYIAVLYNGTDEYDGTVQTFTTLGDPTVTTVTPATAITATGATISGTANTNNTGSYNAFIGYRVNGAGTYQWQNVGTLSSSTSTQSFDRVLTGLTANTTYQYQVAISLDGTVGNEDFFGSIETFTTSAAGYPAVTTGDFGQIAGTSGEITDNVITDDGGDAISSYGIAYGSSANPTTEKQAGTSTGAIPFNYNTSGTSLTPSTLYYVRAYARNSAGTSYGSDKSFYTEPTSVTHFDAISGLDDTEPQNNKSLTLNFGGTTLGNGTGVIIKISSAGGITQPVDGSGPGTISTSSPGNNQVVYFGPNVGSVTITGLDGDKDYEFQMWEYAGDGTTDYGYNYKTDVLPQVIKTNNTEFPIELLSFTAKNDNGNVLIKWTTASETNNDYFEIERSNDAENFEVIANVAGAGYSNTKIDYSIVDNDVLDGTVYYRLKQTDFNGEFTYSYILPVQIGGSNELQISNIISTDNSISFIYNNSKGGNTQVELLDMTGRIVKTQQVSGEGSQLVRMNMRGMSHGIYILHLTIDNEMITKKVVY